MSEEETFIARWSRKKRAAEGNAAEPPKAPQPADASVRPAPEQPRGAPSAKGGEQLGEPPIDPASLPPLDSIAAGTDIRAFLEAGVPADLAKAALRRAWAADPAIRDFIEIAENQWDFANPASVPGFGPLAPNDDVGKLVAQALGRLGHETDAGLQPEKAAATPSPDRQSTSAQPHAAASDVRDAAGQSEAPAPAAVPTQVAAETTPAPGRSASSLGEGGQRPSRRSHGGALPQ